MVKRNMGSIKIGYCDFEEFPNTYGDLNYVSVLTDPYNIERISSLIESEFYFHNRYIDTVINLEDLNSKLKRAVRGGVEKTNEFREDIYEIAKRAYVTDRRFHLDIGYNQMKANEIIFHYLNILRDKGCFYYRLYRRKELIGFTTIFDSDKEVCENLLGAVDPVYQNKGAAFNLYAYMVNDLKENGYKKLKGRISASNISSLNLHITLGAKFISAVDIPYSPLP